MKDVTAWFVILVLPAILIVDAVVWRVFGDEATITWTMRRWNLTSQWPEFVYVLVAVSAYLHLFRGYW